MDNLQDRLQAIFPIHYRSGNILLINADCNEGMKYIKDKEIDLSCVDPPYGIGFERGGQYYNLYPDKKWDIIPTDSYFKELKRISQNQIIWGGNYFYLPPTRCILAWTKTIELQDRTFSEWEMAWTSFDSIAKYINLKPFQRNGERIHPTQKPVKLYEWLLKNYAKQGDKILDTHGGSMSIAIACYNLDFALTLFELDEDYYRAGIARFEEHKKQQRLFP